MTTELGEYHQPTQGPYHEDEIDLQELFLVLWKGKYWIIGTTFVAAIISIIVALSQPNIYKSEALLAVHNERSGGLTGVASQYSGLASLAGISLQSGSSNEKAIGIETLRSRMFISEFVVKHDILPELMAGRSFNWNTGELVYRAKIYDPNSGKWTRNASPPRQPEPSLQEAYERFTEIMRITEDTENGFVRLSIEHPSPYIAQQWVNWIVEDINEQMMLEATSEAQQAIDYLTDQLENTQVVAFEEVFYSLIEEQTKTIMLAKVRPEYLFKTIDPAIVPEENAKPNRPLIAIFGTLFGGILSVMTVLVVHALKTGRQIPGH